MLRRDPHDSSPHALLGQACFALGNDAGARHHLELFLAGAPSGPDSTRAAWLLARVLARSGLHRRALLTLEQVTRRPDAPPGAWHDFSVLLDEDGFRADAVLAEMRALEGSPQDTLFLRTAVQDWKRLSEAEAALCLSARLRGRPQPAAEDFFQAGYLYHLLRRKPEAEAAYRRALLLNPGHPECHYNLAQILAAQGEPDSAEVHYREVIRLRPRFEATYFQLGALLMERERLDAAEDLFKNYLESGTDSLALLHAEEILRVLSEMRGR